MWSGIHRRTQLEFCSITARISGEWIGPGQLVLDMGSGEGDIAQLCLCHKDVVVVCVELSLTRICEAHKKGLPVVLSDAMNLPFRSSIFDTVMSHLLLEFVPNPYKTLEEMRRCLKPSGALILSAPNHANLYEIFQCMFRPRQYSDYLTRHTLNLFAYTPTYLFVMLNRTGYSVDQVVGFVSSLRYSKAGTLVRSAKCVARKIQALKRLPLVLCETIIIKAKNSK